MEHSQVAEVTLTFKMSPYSASQINVAHKLKVEMPTMKGKKSETISGKTALCITGDGKMTQFPSAQAEMFQKKETV